MAFGDRPLFDKRAFVRDLHVTLADEHRDVLEEAIEQLEASFQRAPREGVEKLAQSLSDATGCSLPTAESVLGIVSLFVNSIASEREIAEGVETARAQIQVIAGEKPGLSDSEATRLSELLETLAKMVPAFKRTRDRWRAIRGVLPMYEDLQATIELRSTRSPLASGAEAEAQPTELIPIASVLLVRDSGDPRMVSFQATEEDLGQIQERIERLRKEMQELKGKIRLEGERNE